jgi:predicted dehydrogenase
VRSPANSHPSNEVSAKSAATLVRSRVVVLGASHWHVPLYRDALLDRHQVLAVQDADPDAVDSALSWGVPITTRLEEALASKDIDLAYVFSPHHEMAAVCSTLIERGVPFVIEKPAGIDMAELAAVAAAAQRAGIAVAVPLVQRDAPVEAWLRQVGEISYERLSFVAGPPSRYRHNGSPWMLDPATAGGGCLVNLGPHFVDLALRHIGPDVSSFQNRSVALHHERIEDHATVVLISPAGREAIIEVGYAFPSSPRKRYCSFTAAGSLGFASIDTDGRARFTNLDGVTYENVIDVDSDPLYAGFVNSVADTLPTGFAGLPTLDDLVDAMHIIWNDESEDTVHSG